MSFVELTRKPTFVVKVVLVELTAVKKDRIKMILLLGMN